MLSPSTASLANIVCATVPVSPVVTTEPVKSGRGKKHVVNHVEEFCKSNNIEFKYFTQDAVYSNMDIGISASFAKIFSPGFLKSNNSIFNIHLSLLPALRGPSPVETAAPTGAAKGLVA